MNGKRIFITGGASGLGRALAERYARAGWRVCIGDIHEARGAETVAALGPDAQFVHCDVTRDEDLTAAAAWLERHWGGVDIVVNNAGVAIGGTIDEISLDDWKWIVDINLLGVVRGAKAFTPLLRRQRSGRIVNVASMAGLIHPPIMTAYCATKAAVVAISESLKLELAPDGVDVSVVCPGFFRTNLTETMRSGSADAERVTRRLVERAKLGAPEIADRVFRSLARGDFYVLTHPDGRVAWMVKRLVAAPVYFAFMQRMTKQMMSRRTPPAAVEPG